MASYVQKLRGTLVQIKERIFPEGVLTASTDTHDVQVHDGKTKGGFGILERANTYTDEAIEKGKPNVTGGVPIGMIMPFAMPEVPDGWFECDGTYRSKADYPGLFKAIGMHYGNSADDKWFRLPDLRGEFIRGWIAGREDIGSEKGRALGSWQAQSLQKHPHEFTSDWVKEHNHWTPMGISQVAGIPNKGTTLFNVNFDGGRQTGGGGAHNVHGWTASVGGDETRPQNVALMYCIKY